MRDNRLQRTLRQVRHSRWYPVVAALPLSFVISLAWSHGASGGTLGFIASFVAIEGLVILISVVARPALQAEQLLGRVGFVEVDTLEARILIGKTEAEWPPPELVGDWTRTFPDFREAWVSLLKGLERALRAENLTLENLRAVIDTLALASAQIRAGSAFDMLSLKRAACYLGCSESQGVTRVLIVNRIQPALWFTPEMVIYHLDLLRHGLNHPLKPPFIRISVLEDEELSRIGSPQWRVSRDVDPLKAFIAVNQIAGVCVKGLAYGEFSQVVESFLAQNEARVQAIAGTDTRALKEFVRDVAFLMYCDGDRPVKVFRGRPYPPLVPQSRHTTSVIMFPEIVDPSERELYRDLFAKLDVVAEGIPPLNLSQSY